MSDDSKPTLSVAEDGHRVTMDLKIEDPETKEVMVDTFTGDSAAVSFIIGQGQVIPGLEARTKGLKVGETWEAVLKPEEAFGEYTKDKVFMVQLRTNPETKQIVEKIPEVGSTVTLTDNTLGRVLSVDEDKALAAIDTNHRLAGKDVAVTAKLNTVEEAGEQVWSGVQIQPMEPGDGKTYPKPGDTVQVHYVGMLASSGKVFDQSRAGQPIEFQLGTGRVIRGWDDGISKLSLGERARLFIAAEFGYGAQGAGDAIPPDANLVFDVELCSINGQMAPDASDGPDNVSN